jgi:hypothetical protein
MLMKWAPVILVLLVVGTTSGCWRPLHGQRYAQPVYSQAPVFQAPPSAYSQPAPIVTQPAPVVQQAPATIVQQAPVMQQGCQPVYCQPCPQVCTPCY